MNFNKMKDTVQPGFYLVDKTLLDKLHEKDENVINDAETVYFGPVLTVNSARGPVSLFAPFDKNTAKSSDDDTVMQKYAKGIIAGVNLSLMIPVLPRFIKNAKLDADVDTSFYLRNRFLFEEKAQKIYDERNAVND